MSTRANRANRTVLTVLGLLLLVAAVVGLVISFAVRIPGGLALPRSGGPILPSRTLTAANDSPWLWWAVAATCVAIAVLALRWLLAQFATDRVGHLDLTENYREGTTTLTAHALTEAIADEAKTYPGVDDASAHLRDRPHRTLLLAVDVAEYADINTVRDQIEHGAIPHLRHVIGDPDLPVTVQLRPTNTRRNVT